jgi:sialic acid synthase SpsE
MITEPPLETIMQILDTPIGEGHPTYFIADIAANHDGDLARAQDLIHRCAQAGANAAKFQHFRAETIVSDIRMPVSVWTGLLP